MQFDKNDSAVQVIRYSLLLANIGVVWGVFYKKNESLQLSERSGTCVTFSWLDQKPLLIFPYKSIFDTLLFIYSCRRFKEWTLNKRRISSLKVNQAFSAIWAATSRQISRNLRLRREILVFEQKGILMGISRNSLQSRSFVKNLEFKDILDLPWF